MVRSHEFAFDLRAKRSSAPIHRKRGMSEPIQSWHEGIKRFGDLLKVAGIVVGLAAPALTFYGVTKAQLAEQNVRLAHAENRLDKMENQLAASLEKVVTKLEVCNERITSIAATLNKR